MSDWYQISDGPELTITFLPKDPDCFWSPEILRERPLSVAGAAGRAVILTGPSAVWMYAHAAAKLRAAGATRIEVRTKLSGDSQDHRMCCHCDLIPSTSSQAALLSVHLRKEPPLSPWAIDELIRPALEELAKLRPQEFCISGRAGPEVYTTLAWMLDCDGQAPTPHWYLSMLGQDKPEATTLRKAIKRDWTSEMEASIARQIQTGRDVFLKH